MKDNRGEITIMMIITVIVLIIFGGICIFMLTGENGLFVLKTKQQNNNNLNTNVQQETTNLNSQNEVNETVEGNNTVVDDKSNQTTNQNGAITVPVQ